MSRNDESARSTSLSPLDRQQRVSSPEHIIKKFYQGLKYEYELFQRQITGLAAAHEQYISLMLCRLLFLYFLQKRGYLDGDPCYLPNHLQRTRERCGTDMFYRVFLLRLFREGLGTTIRPPETQALFGNIPYLGGDLFLLHQLEHANPQLHISDEAFCRLFTFFEGYRWHLDEHPRHYKNEITPGILGYILEKYINQQQVRAYFTREDVTHYIASSTIIPSLCASCQRPGAAE